MRFTPVTVLAGVVSAVMSSLMMTMRTPATMLMISMIVLSSSSETSASTVTAMGNHSRRKQKQLQQQQQQQQHQHSASSQSSSNPSTLSSTKGSSNPHHHRHHHHENCSGSPDVTKHHRRACRFYIWDGPSALLYKWCNHLLKDHIYEGRGGYLFVRFESNSVLQLLFPCDRFSPNKCALCGGSFPDHLELWWSTHLYSPFDQHLDKTYKDALNVVEDETKAVVNNNNNRNKDENRRRPSFVRRNQQNGSKRGRSSPSMSSSTATTMKGPPTFSFHKPYVTDVSDLVRGTNDPQKIREQIRHSIKEGQEQKNKGKLRPWNAFRSRHSGKSVSSSSPLLSIPPPPPMYDAYRLKRLRDADTSYLVPARTVVSGGGESMNTVTTPTTMNSLKERFVDMLCGIALWTVDDMIYIQGIENRLLKKYKRQSQQYR